MGRRSAVADVLKRQGDARATVERLGTATPKPENLAHVGARRDIQLSGMLSPGYYWAEDLKLSI